MVVAQSAESYVREFAEELERWQGRIGNLRYMAAAAGPQGRGQIEAGAGRLESILRGARDLLGDRHGMGGDEWMEIHPKVTAALRAAQSCYNNLVADWPVL